MSSEFKSPNLEAFIRKRMGASNTRKILRNFDNRKQSVLNKTLIKAIQSGEYRCAKQLAIDSGVSLSTVYRYQSMFNA